MMMVMMAVSLRALFADGHYQRGVGGGLLAHFGIGKRRFVHHFHFPQTFNQRQHIDLALFVGLAGKSLRLAVVVGGGRIALGEGVGSGGNGAPASGSP